MKISFRVEGIPIWVTYVVGFFTIFSTTLGVMGLINPTTVMGYFEGADNLATAWAGRNAGIGMAMGIAFYFRSSPAYAAVFLAAIMRELGDFQGFFTDGITTSEIFGMAFFGLLDLSCFGLSLKAALQTRTNFTNSQ